jgi:uncharacterized protein YjdB
MRTGDFENRWSSPKQLYNEYMSNYNMIRKDNVGQLSQPRISKIAISRTRYNQERKYPQCDRSNQDSFSV